MFHQKTIVRLNLHLSTGFPKQVSPEAAAHCTDVVRSLATNQRGGTPSLVTGNLESQIKGYQRQADFGSLAGLQDLEKLNKSGKKGKVK